MKQKLILLALLVLVIGFCGAQNTVTGNYIGQLSVDRSICTIKIKRNHKYILETYDVNGKFVKRTTGEWYAGGEKLVLNGNAGPVLVLEKLSDTNTWYVAGNNPYMFTAKFSRNVDEKEFLEALKRGGC
ncbi:MAG TPA: hypothetical protein VI112_08560 [Bacteroidia bacterium]|jgi:hypothetical protein